MEKHVKKIFQHKKFICLAVVISMFFLNLPTPPARAVMITTEEALVQRTEPLSDRERVKAMLARADVIAQLQAYGISCGEAQARVDSLTDRELAVIADKMDRLASKAGGYEMGSGALWIVGLLMYTIVFLIVFYFSRAKMKEDLEKSSTAETEEKIESSTIEKEQKAE